MAAIIHIFEHPTSTSVDKDGQPIVFRNTNTAIASGAADEIPRPTINFNYSYEKWLRLEVVGGIYATLSNIKFFWGGDFSGDSTNYKLAYRLVTGSPPVYAAPIKPANSAFPPPGFASAMTFLGPATALTVNLAQWNSSNATGPGTNQAYLVLVLGVSAGALGGIVPGDTMTWLIDAT